jgi:hypothetical protein
MTPHLQSGMPAARSPAPQQSRKLAPDIIKIEYFIVQFVKLDQYN